MPLVTVLLFCLFCAVSVCWPKLGMALVQAEQSPSEMGAVSGSSAENAIAIDDDEVSQHFRENWPQIRLRTDQVEPDWPDWWTTLEFSVMVSDEGYVVSANFDTNTNGERHSWAVKAAEEQVRTLRFVPFKRNGHPVFATFEIYVPILPPERLPSVHLPFPELKDRKTLVMTLSRSRCFGFCPEYKIQIHGDGRVEYQGACAVAVIGRRTSRIPRNSVDQLLVQFRNSDFFSLEDKYALPVMDPPWEELSLSIDGRHKVVREHLGPYDGMPDSVEKLEEEIDTETNSRQWTQAGYSSAMDAARSHPCK